MMCAKVAEEPNVYQNSLDTIGLILKLKPMLPGYNN
jgi:hypothetical protein